MNTSKIVSQTIDGNEHVINGKELEFADVLAVKSDDELKFLIKDEHKYDTAFVDVARNELMERVLGHRQQRTEEDVAAEKAERERLHLDHEARLQAEREERKKQRKQ